MEDSKLVALDPPEYGTQNAPADAVLATRGPVVIDMDAVSSKKQGIDWEFVWDEIKWYAQYIGPIFIGNAIIVALLMGIILGLKNRGESDDSGSALQAPVAPPGLLN